MSEAEKQEYWDRVNKIAKHLQLEKTRIITATVDAQKEDANMLRDVWLKTKTVHKSGWDKYTVGENLTIIELEDYCFKLPWNTQATATA